MPKKPHFWMPKGIALPDDRDFFLPTGEQGEGWFLPPSMCSIMGVTAMSGFGGGGMRTLILTSASNTDQYNVRNQALAAGLQPAEVANIIVNMNHVCYSSSPGGWAFWTGTGWPAGTPKLILNNNGRIQGYGGAGGTPGVMSGQTIIQQGGPGGNGGHAFVASYFIDVFNTGLIYAGGGGGGGGAAAYWEITGGTAEAPTSTPANDNGGGGGGGMGWNDSAGNGGIAGGIGGTAGAWNAPGVGGVRSGSPRGGNGGGGGVPGNNNGFGGSGAVGAVLQTNFGSGGTNGVAGALNGWVILQLNSGTILGTWA